MHVKSHFLFMANYNARMNKQILSVAENLSQDELTANKGAYFYSILGTLNHILVGDIIWLTRFNLHSKNYESLKSIIELPKPKGLNDILYPDIKSFTYAREVK